MLKKSDYLVLMTSKETNENKYFVVKDCLTMKEASDKLYENKLIGMKASEWTLNKIERLEGKLEVISSNGELITKNPVLLINDIFINNSCERNLVIVPGYDKDVMTISIRHENTIYKLMYEKKLDALGRDRILNLNANNCNNVKIVNLTNDTIYFNVKINRVINDFSIYIDICNDSKVDKFGRDNIRLECNKSVTLSCENIKG